MKNKILDKYFSERLGIWCQNEHGKSWIIKKMDAIPIIMSLFEGTILSNSITLNEFENRFFEALNKRQIIIYYFNGLPIAVLTWAFLSKADANKYSKSNNIIPNAWCTGKELWFIDFFHNFDRLVPKWILFHIKYKVFPDHKAGFSKRTVSTQESTLNKIKRWKNTFSEKHNKLNYKHNLPENQATRFKYTHPFRAYDLDRNLLDKAEKQLLLKHDIKQGACILVCGTEANEFAMKIAHRFECEVILYDTNAGLLTQSAEIAASARKRLQEPNFSIRHGLWDKLPFKNKSIDHIFSFGAIARSNDTKQTFSELMRITKTGAQISLVELESSDKNSKNNHSKKLGIKKLLRKNEWQILIETYAQNGITQFSKIVEEHWAAPIKSWFHKACASNDLTKKSNEDDDISSFVFFFQRNGKKITTQTKNLKKRKLVTLVTLSGGVDSTYLLWKLLKVTDDEIIALHVNIANNEGRSEVERIRTEQILLYLSKEIRKFHYVTTGMDHKGLNWYGYDMMTVAFEVGITATSFLFKTNRAVDRWTVASCEEEGGWPKRSVHWKACVAATCYPHRPPPFFAFPTISKMEQMKQMPRELLALTWYCRRPVITRDGYKTCGLCKTCQLVQELNQDQKYPDDNFKRPYS